MFPASPVARRAACIVLLCAALSAPTAAPAAPAAVPSGAPALTPDVPPAEADAVDPYFPLDGNRGLDVRRYAIRVGYDFDSGVLRGSTVVRLRTTERLKRITLDFLLKATSVRVDGVRADFTRRAGHELVITPRRALAAGTRHRIRVTYADRPGRYSYLGQDNWAASKSEMVTVNQPHMAPWWFPSNDHPSDKARFDVTVLTEKGREAISNGLPISRRPAGDKVAWRWRAKDPMATYLAFVAVGDFAIERGATDGVPWVNAVSERLGKRRRDIALSWLRRTPAIQSWLSSEIGTYPFEATGGLVSSLPFGFALENQTRPIYPYVGKADWLLVHELAHQWFGDAVAVTSWRDIWLNEGFATYFEQRYEETHGGQPADSWLRLQYDAFGAESPFWRLTIDDPGRKNLFDAAVYQRGGMTLVALRRVIGTEAFAALVKQWGTGRAHGTTEEFRALAEQVSGRDLDAFFDAWLSSPTRPADIPELGLG